jgi:hypothetical protein
MNSPTRLRAGGALGESEVEEVGVGREAGGSPEGDGVLHVSRRRRSVTLNPSSGASATAPSLAHAQTPAV